MKILSFKNLKILNNEIISFKLEDQFIEKFISTLEDKNSNINPYYQRFKHMNLIIILKTMYLN